MRIPIKIICDEFTVMGRFPLISSGMARYRAFGVQFWLLIQGMSQLEMTYESGWKTIMSNAGVTITFGGTNDPLTQSEFSRLGGEETIVVKNVGFSHGGTEGSSEGYSFAKKPIYSPDAIANLEPPKMLCHFTGKGMAEGSLFDPSLRDFPAYVAFMRALGSGLSAEDAAKIARDVQSGMQLPTPPPQPAPVRSQTPRRGINPGKMLDKGLAHLFGQDTDF